MKFALETLIVGSRLVTVPLYLSDAHLGRLVLGERADLWKDLVRELEREGLPSRSRLFSGMRYVPTVLEFFDLREGLKRTGTESVLADDGPENWGPP
jgi:hypothetical protein